MALNALTAPGDVTSAGPGHRPARPGLLGALDRPGQVSGAITPNWFAAVMGTGIVAIAAAALPTQFPGLRTFGEVVWVLAGALLIAVTAATAVAWRTARPAAAGYHRDPVMCHFYGAPPMAMLAVGAGTLLLGQHLIGLRAAVGIDWVLWAAGTVTGLAVAVTIPHLARTRPDGAPGAAFGGWLMPVVPPMVSAATGALLIPHTPAGPARAGLLIGCYAMFGLSLAASLVVFRLLWRRLSADGPGPAAMVPTWWIVLGPLGQSVTAVNLLGRNAYLAVPAPWARAMQAFGLLYGLPVWGLALLWAGVAGVITVRTARRGLPFSLTWWSFTFPVGTLVTGTAALAVHTGSGLLRVSTAVLFAALVTAWLTVATRTLRGSLRGDLFLHAIQATTAAHLLG
jgi:C4-dicarboxylate transporter/malic acid transport protein